MRKDFVILAVAAVIVTGVFYYLASNDGNAPAPNQSGQDATGQDQGGQVQETVPGEEKNEAAQETQTAEPQTGEEQNEPQTVIGKSAGGKDILAYHFGTGEKEVLFVGGTHGGYSWNTALLAYQAIDYFTANPDAVPAGEKVTIIPVLNPDGLSRVVDAAGRFKPTDVSASTEARVAGRFNANNVDLNRNFDCNWQSTAIWQDKTVSGGTKVFSEPETAAIRDYAQNPDLTAVVAWYSSAGGVFSSSCNGDVLPETQTLTDVYANASGYPAHKDFDYYQISGDMTNWFAKSSIPAIGVVLTSSDDVEWDKNLAGIKAVLQHYAD